MQKVQNKAIRTALRLPRYVSLKLLHESAGLLPVRERLIQLGSGLVARMARNNPLIGAIVKKHKAELLQKLFRVLGLTGPTAAL